MDLAEIVIGEVQAITAPVYAVALLSENDFAASKRQSVREGSFARLYLLTSVPVAQRSA